MSHAALMQASSKPLPSSQKPASTAGGSLPPPYMAAPLPLPASQSLSSQIEPSPVPISLLPGSPIISTQLLPEASQLETQNTKSTFDTQVPSSQVLDYSVLVTTLMDEKALHASTTTGFKPVSWKHCTTALEGPEDTTGSKAKYDRSLEKDLPELQDHGHNFRRKLGLNQTMPLDNNFCVGRTADSPYTPGSLKAMWPQAISWRPPPTILIIICSKWGQLLRWNPTMTLTLMNLPPPQLLPAKRKHGPTMVPNLIISELKSLPLLLKPCEPQSH
ncbi:hypothetical protein VP01_233g1 [Puccinia sorghi]|uniref:Uncharacterized protein n=1 Tax=Puccinia sorghi TaxID=27349 RepID=A0A0L6V830_9BASI|nr:hypothetical protein VP01_233g1 [Puccinia sorghi]